MHEVEIEYPRDVVEDSNITPADPVEYVITNSDGVEVKSDAMTPEDLLKLMGNKRKQLKAFRRHMKLMKREVAREPMKAKRKTASRKKNAAAKASRKRNR